MGVSSFNSGAAFMLLGSRGGYSGVNNPSPRKGVSWLWLTINIILFSVALTTLIFLACDFTKYVRVGKLYDKTKSSYMHKNRKYSDYFFTVKWNDRGREIETFQVTDNTYFSVHNRENVYFKRIKPEYEWLSGWMGFVGLVVFGVAWIFSGVAALLKND